MRIRTTLKLKYVILSIKEGILKNRVISIIPILLLVAIFSTLVANAAETAPYDSLDKYCEDEFSKLHMPGMSVEIVDGSRVLFAETYGNCDSLDSPFIIGSISKTFTAVAIMQLVEQGKINLSDPIADYLYDVRETKITIKQLLNHTSGISTYDTLEDYKTSYEPEEYQYANVNFSLLGQIVESVTGTDYGSYIQKNIFDPLGMEHSYISLAQAKTDNIASGYRNYFGIMAKQDVAYPDSIYEGWLTLPNGYILSSANDMGSYMQMYLNNGANILSENSVNTMINDNVDVQENYKYGMGLGIDYRSGELMVVHGGNVENYTTYMIIMPQRDIAVIVMCNGCDFFVANELLIDLSYNIINKYLGLDTEDLNANTYLSMHLIINVILLVVVLLSFLPLLLMKRWAKKIKNKIKPSAVILSVVLHLILPTLILLIFNIIGVPLFVVSGFAPDVFHVILSCSGILYLAGILKLIYCIRFRHKTK